MTVAACSVHWTRPGESPAARRLLTGEEAQRCAALRQPADRARFVTGRALIRVTLGRLLGRPPDDIEIRRDCRHCGRSHGKPYVPDAGLAFSLSHSARRVVLAVCDTAEPGVDVQHIGRDVSDRLAGAVLSGAELERFAAVPPAERTAAFASAWARKEALLKATGHGLAAHMAGITVTGHRDPARLLRWAGGPDLPPVALADLAGAGRCYAAAVAVIGATRVAVTEHHVADPFDSAPPSDGAPSFDDVAPCDDVAS